MTLAGALPAEAGAWLATGEAAADGDTAGLADADGAADAAAAEAAGAGAVGGLGAPVGGAAVVGAAVGAAWHAASSDPPRVAPATTMPRSSPRRDSRYLCVIHLPLSRCASCARIWLSR